MALNYPDVLHSSNLTETGFPIAWQKEISGCRNVATLNDLYNIYDYILSPSKTNEDDDALGFMAFVKETGSYFILKDWSNRDNAAGWEELSSSAQIPPMRKIYDYTYEMYCSNLDYDNAYKYYAEEAVEVPGACTSVKKDLFYGRNFDWTYDNTVDFVVRTPNMLGRYATVGFGGFSSDLTAEFVESKRYSASYKLVPFKIVDGINEKGVVVNTNVVPLIEGRTTTQGAIGTKETICNMMLPRYILDNFATAKEAADYIRDYVSVTNFKTLGDKFHYDLHVMVGDKDNVYVIEFIGSANVVKDLTSKKAIMTNFHLNGVTFNEDGNVCTPEEHWLDGSKDPATVNNIEAHGAGLERYNIANHNYDDIDNVTSMMSLMDALKYTKTYTLESDKWYTECVGTYDSYGDVTVSSEEGPFSSIMNIMRDYYQNRSRDDAKTWQTVHSCVYDISKKIVKVIFQESNEVFEFSVASNDFNLVNGSTEGSVRGINTDEESSQYVMGKNAIAVGNKTKADGESSFAEGDDTHAIGEMSHAAGYQTKAWKKYSFAEGYRTDANGEASHAEGANTKTNNPVEHAQGQYNISNTNESGIFGSADNTLFSIGNGTASPSLVPENNKNAVEVMQNGDMYVQGIGEYTGKNYSEASTLQEVVNSKVDKEEGKGLSSNDYTDEEKAKLSGIEEGAQVNVQSDWSQNDESQDDYIKNRICYEGAEVTKSLFPEIKYGDGQGFHYNFIPTQPLKINKTYVFSIEGLGDTNISLNSSHGTNESGRYDGNVPSGYLNMTWNTTNGIQTISMNINSYYPNRRIDFTITEAGISTIDKKWLPEDTVYTTNLQNAISVETNRATAAEASLQTSINTEKSERESAITYLESLIESGGTDLSEEVERAKAAEAEIKGDLESEITRASGKESELGTAISSETTRATAAESEISTNLENNYYTKSETYTQDEVKALVKAHLSLAVVEELPPLEDASTTTIYLVPLHASPEEEDNIYEEYICIEDASTEERRWELIGTAEVNLSNYVQFDDVYQSADLIATNNVLFTLKSDDGQHASNVYIQPTAPKADVEAAFDAIFGA